MSNEANPNETTSAENSPLRQPPRRRLTRPVTGESMTGAPSVPRSSGVEPTTRIPRRPLTPPRRLPRSEATGEATQASPSEATQNTTRSRHTRSGLSHVAESSSQAQFQTPTFLAGTPNSTNTDGTRVEAPPTTGMRSRRLEIERRKAIKRRKAAKIRTAIILTLVGVLMLACGYLAINALRGGSTVEEEIPDYEGSGTTEVIAVVNPGDTGSAIAKQLVQLDVVKSEAAFIKAWEANQAATSVQPGSYTLKLKMSGVEAVAALLDPTKRTSNAISIPPGFTIWQVVERLKAFERFTPEQVDAALSDTVALGLPAEAKGNLEGWLLPGSYEVHTDDTPADVLKTMVAATIKELDELGVPANQRQVLLTKASILEREVNNDEYMKQVARVIENRLTQPNAETVGLLQMDSTVLYGLKRAGGVPTGDEVKQDTPYNTYIHKGLPPGPISMPSRAAVEATLNPADGTWLYFVTVNLNTGETKFSSTNAEHQKYVEELSTWCAANKGSC
ncbi:YceG family protein [Gleimia coleocanis DSM 15436]|uniref:Endolytic murein transglycosylase n=1 Tax=Gleimia coleocanis DSM 15436 TaxID=525245 RepID=C0W1N0_9ACTO|nr:endolytic transglycosylase MltG [Gleimia coleocanis]EEH63396.1 YceG family protein [Gleimia coleocanis DSM 15436]